MSAIKHLSILFRVNYSIWSIGDQRQPMSNEFKSRQVLNDVNKTGCIIEFQLPEEASITLSILNEQGKVVALIIEKGKYLPGRYEIAIEDKKYNGQFSFYRLSMQTKQGEIVDTKKIVSTIHPAG
ncbi:MAG: hypothetical protein ACHQQQ_02575 [Bacteroidota bacterium]